LSFCRSFSLGLLWLPVKRLATGRIIFTSNLWSDYMRPLNATHVDQQGNYWSIPRADLSDGTGELWTGHKWITSEISDAFVQTLTRLQPLLSERISDTN